ncbi:MAG: DUF3558 family protein [Candidatus Limnocylindria bacterium]
MPRIISRQLSMVITVATLLLLVACGGAATDTGNDGGGGGTDATEAPDTEAPDTGGDGGDGGTGDGFDLCATLSLDEVSDAAGVEATEQTGVNLTQGQASCNYNGEGGSAIAGHTYTTGLSGIDPSAMFDANFQAAGAEEIDGIGDSAVLVGDDNFPMLWVLKGDGLYAITVLASDLDGQGKRDAMIELARKAVDRLP